jgi:hypothetical protein
MTELEKVNNRLAIRLNLELLLSERRVFNVFWKRLPVMVAFFTGTGPHVCHARADISDGGDFGEGTMCFCSSRPDAALVPDVDFIRRHGYRRYRQLAEANPCAWADRKSVVLWRGAASDAGAWATELEASNPNLKPRIRMAVLLRDMPDVDVKIISIPFAPPSAMASMQQYGVAGAFVPPQTWLTYKFAIDIDGVTNAWSNLFIRHLLGCCVLKVASPRGFRQWYYDDLVPWQHYVPVKSDMTDLRERIAWCFANDEQCRGIAAAAQDLAMRRTVETETIRTIRLLDIRLSDGPASAQRLSGAGASGST